MFRLTSNNLENYMNKGLIQNFFQETDKIYLMKNHYFFPKLKTVILYLIP